MSPVELPLEPERRPRRRRALRAVGVVLLILLAAAAALNARFAAPRYEGPPSEHFDGRAFRNRVPIGDRGLLDVLRWRLARDVDAWDDYDPPATVPAVPDERVHGEALRVTFVGHASVLIQTAGLNVLTDPIWSERASPVSWAGPARHAPPGIRFEDLPPIDAVLVSHNHYDHLDVDTLERLAAEHGPAIWVPLGNAALLGEHDVGGGRDLDWWDRVELADGVWLSCVPARHFSGRALTDRGAALWAGFVLETPGGVVYFAGDTGDGPHFEQTRARFGAPRLALLPIGAYLPPWFMSPVHVDPREAAEVHLRLGARTSLAIHFGCFELGDDGPTQPAEELAAARIALGIDPGSFWILAAGEARDVP